MLVCGAEARSLIVKNGSGAAPLPFFFSVASGFHV